MIRFNHRWSTLPHRMIILEDRSMVAFEEPMGLCAAVYPIASQNAEQTLSSRTIDRLLQECRQRQVRAYWALAGIEMLLLVLVVALFVVALDIPFPAQLLIACALGIASGTARDRLWNCLILPAMQMRARRVILRYLRACGLDVWRTLLVESAQLHLLRAEDTELMREDPVDVTQLLRDRHRRETRPSNRPTYGLPGPVQQAGPISTQEGRP